MKYPNFVEVLLTSKYTKRKGGKGRKSLFSHDIHMYVDSK
jgi:hypothetical protein